MAGSSSELHESPDDLASATVDRHRAIVSLMEELEAVDWYDQRVDATTDDELATVLAHNRDEEKEHAAMTLEWLRRHDAALDQHLRTYLFTEAPILDIEEVAAGEGDGDGAGTEGAEGAVAAEVREPGSESSLGIGSLKGTGAL